MIGNIVEYVHSYGFFDFSALPFSAVDALVLAQFVYLKVEEIMAPMAEQMEPMTLEEMQAHPDVEKLFADSRFEENNRALFREMCESKRYKDMKCLYVTDHICLQNETQFMAMTCILSDGSTKILYRGTDETLVGWKEDFNMAFQYPIPGQDSARSYLEQIAEWVQGEMELIGHSKGGNLAVYAAMNAATEIQNRITAIYNLDGPGFRTEVYKMGLFEKVEGKIVKIIPESSVVGMILGNHGSYKVVDSKRIGFLQHDPYSWLIDRIDFVYRKDMDKAHRIMDESLNEWVMSFSKEEVSAFVNTLYQIVSASEATDLISFTKHWTKSLSGMASAIQNLDNETKAIMHRIMKKLAASSRERIKEETGNYFSDKIEDLNQFLRKERT